MANTAIEPHLAILRTQGLRITPIVTAVLNYLSETKKVSTANELRAEMSQTLSYELDNSTIYRICERLMMCGVLCSMHKYDGIMRYFLCSQPKNNKHHHFICTHCHRVQEVYCNVDDKIRKVISEKLHGIVEKKFIQVEGICKECKE